MSKALLELKGKIEAKRNRVAELLANKHADGSYNLDGAQIDEVKALNRELNEDLGPKLDQFLQTAKIERENAASLDAMKTVGHPAGHGGGMQIQGGDGFALTRDGQLVSMTPQVKNIGDLFIGSREYKAVQAAAAQGDDNAFKRLTVSLSDYDLKTLFARTAGWDPFVNRQPGVVLSAQQQPVIADLLPMIETSQQSVKWMLETTYTNSAAEVAEAGTIPESAFALTEQNTPVQKIATSLPFTDEQMEDEPRARDYLNNRLTLNLKQRLDLQLLVGNGTAPNLRGLLNIAGIQTQAKGADPDLDAIFKAMVKIQAVAFANPTAIIMHPTDWQGLRLLRSNGIYILGNPADAASPRIWGMPIVTSTYETLGTALVGDYAGYTELCYRRGITFDMTNSHGTDFLVGTQRMRASLRVALVVTRPAALCTVTGLLGS